MSPVPPSPGGPRPAGGHVPERVRLLHDLHLPRRGDGTCRAESVGRGGGGGGLPGGPAPRRPRPPPRSPSAAPSAASSSRAAAIASSAGSGRARSHGAVAPPSRGHGARPQRCPAEGRPARRPRPRHLRGGSGGGAERCGGAARAAGAGGGVGAAGAPALTLLFQLAWRARGRRRAAPRASGSRARWPCGSSGTATPRNAPGGSWPGRGCSAPCASARDSRASSSARWLPSTSPPPTGESAAGPGPGRPRCRPRGGGLNHGLAAAPRPYRDARAREGRAVSVNHHSVSHSRYRVEKASVDPSGNSESRVCRAIWWESRACSCRVSHDSTFKFFGWAAQHAPQRTYLGETLRTVLKRA